MTPLAHRLARDLLIPVHKRIGNDAGLLLREMSDVHCFDVTSVGQLGIDLAKKITDETVASTDYMTFLPAPKTWIEYHEQGNRLAYMLKQRPDLRSADVWFITDVVHKERPRDYYSTHSLTPLALTSPHIVGARRETDPYGNFIESVLGFKEQGLIYAWLCIINSPKVLGRRQHMPHRGLQRKLAQKFGGVGSFPLHAWTEVLLHAMPVDATMDPSRETHLTGQRCLHFCRAHLRFRYGRVEFVHSHWRGDAALGIKQSRYTVKP